MSKSKKRSKQHPASKLNSANSGSKSEKNKEAASDKSTSKKPSLKKIFITAFILLFGILLLVVLPQLIFTDSGKLSIVYPHDGSLFPPEIRRHVFMTLKAC